VAARNLGVFEQLNGRKPGRNMMMEISALFAKYRLLVQEFLAPNYRSALYARPGPAYAQRAILVESKRVLPLLRNPQR
jgi:hypothetical protein